MFQDVWVRINWLVRSILDVLCWVWIELFIFDLLVGEGAGNDIEACCYQGEI
jgi:hypothetical protein